MLVRRTGREFQREKISMRSKFLPPRLVAREMKLPFLPLGALLPLAVLRRGSSGSTFWVAMRRSGLYSRFFTNQKKEDGDEMRCIRGEGWQPYVRQAVLYEFDPVGSCGRGAPGNPIKANLGESSSSAKALVKGHEGV